MSIDKITYGPVHLCVTNIEIAQRFWSEVVGLVVRDGGEVVELGTPRETLIVLHGGAQRPVQRGCSGLYHVAIHVPNEGEFGRVLARLIALRVPVSPTDHLMSKALYLYDPDGIGIELTLETPERMGEWRVSAEGYPQAIDPQGMIHSGRDPLDVGAVLNQLPDEDLTQSVPEGTTVGHIHLHVGNLREAVNFYRDVVGFEEAMFFDKVGMADMHAGGVFKHRLALNTWEGEGVQPAPQGSAGLLWFTVRGGCLQEGAVVRDPWGNEVRA